MSNVFQRTPEVAHQRYLELVHACGVYHHIGDYQGLYALATGNLMEGRNLDLLVLSQAEAERIACEDLLYILGQGPHVQAWSATGVSIGEVSKYLLTLAQSYETLRSGTIIS